MICEYAILEWSRNTNSPTATPQWNKLPPLFQRGASTPKKISSIVHCDIFCWPRPMNQFGPGRHDALTIGIWQKRNENESCHSIEIFNFWNSRIVANPSRSWSESVHWARCVCPVRVELFLLFFFVCPLFVLRRRKSICFILFTEVRSGNWMGMVPVAKVQVMHFYCLLMASFVRLTLINGNIA